MVKYIMQVADLISAKMEGQSFEKIFHAVRSRRERVSTLPEDQVDFLESMLSEIKTATGQFEEAVKNDDLRTIKEMAQTFQEIFTMVADCCETDGREVDHRVEGLG